MKSLNTFLSIVSFFICSLNYASANTYLQSIPLKKGEKIWSGVINKGDQMPLNDKHYVNLYNDNYGNQTQPLLLSNMGRYVWSDDPFIFSVERDTIFIHKSKSEIQTRISGKTLAEAHQEAMKKFFPPKNQIPDELFFSAPQYNTWIELMYNQNQEDIISYAQDILDNGLPPGILMIDDTWQEDYGLWNFHPGRFPDPKEMVVKLHEMGFKVMLWVCPFVSSDQYLVCQEVMAGKGFILQQDTLGQTWNEASIPMVTKWWNGHSYVIDFSNPYGEKWFRRQLDRLVNEYGIDGFKFDAGDAIFYDTHSLTYGNTTPTDQSFLFAKIGLDYPFNEYRACWKMGNEPLVQRLRDKQHSWEDLQILIPNMILQNIMGYTYSCPDLIAGGDFVSFMDKSKIDSELIVRSTQCQALMTMMQFSVAPWNVLDKPHLNAVKKAVDIRTKFTPLIMRLVEESKKTGMPIIKSMEYAYPHSGYIEVKDQFLLGDDLIVAPMIYANQHKRVVVLPQGKWLADDGKIYRGGKRYEIDVPLERIPYFEKIKY